MQHTILVVDDDLPILKLNSILLSKLGYRVLTANCGQNAMEVWSSQKTPIDLLFTDVFMPDMSGVELAAALRALQPELKVVYTTGAGRERVEEMFSNPNEVRLLKKPASIENLADCVRQAITGE